MKILHVIKTSSLDSDGRLLKWISFLKSSRIDSDVHIIQDNNLTREYKDYNANIISKGLKSRKFFKKYSGYFLKIPEYAIVFSKYFFSNYRKYDYVVFHDMQQYLNILLVRIFIKRWQGKVIWDMHELPHSIFFKNFFLKKFLSHLLGSVDLLIYTNADRRMFTLERLSYAEKSYALLNNYPDNAFNSLDRQTLRNDVLKWLDGKKYILWLGGGSKTRNFDVFLEVYNQNFSDTFKLIVLGRIDKSLEGITQDLIKERKLFVTFVKQYELINYIDNAEFSVVLYKDNSFNNKYCEPNRLYQLINRGIPVVVGNNPTMKNLLLNQEIGVILDDDGSNYSTMLDGFVKMISNIDTYKHKLAELNVNNQLNIDSQFLNITNKIQNEKL